MEGCCASAGIVRTAAPTTPPRRLKLRTFSPAISPTTRLPHPGVMRFDTRGNPGTDIGARCARHALSTTPFQSVRRRIHFSELHEGL